MPYSLTKESGEMTVLQQVQKERCKQYHVCNVTFQREEELGKIMSSFFTQVKSVDKTYNVQTKACV